MSKAYLTNIEQDVIYPNIRYCICDTLSDTEKVNIIDYFHECYFNTAIAVEDFAVEFQRIVAHILSGCIPVRLEYLEDFEEGLFNLLDTKNYWIYRKALELSRNKEGF